jgi:hypothetical protein
LVMNSLPLTMLAIAGPFGSFIDAGSSHPFVPSTPWNMMGIRM